MSWIRHILHGNKRSHDELRQLNTAMLAFFSGFLSENPGWALEHIPDDAIILAELEGDEEFNLWARKLVYTLRRPEQQVFTIRFRQVRDNGGRIEIHPAILKERSRTATTDSSFF